MHVVWQLRIFMRLKGGIMIIPHTPVKTSGCRLP